MNAGDVEGHLLDLMISDRRACFLAIVIGEFLGQTAKGGISSRLSRASGTVLKGMRLPGDCEAINTLQL